MGLWGRIRRNVLGGLIRAEERAAAQSYENFIKWFVPHNIFARKGGTALANNEIIFSCVTELANAMASLPLKLFRNLEHQTEHHLNYLMSFEPNVNMTSLQFIQTMEVLRNVYGNAYAQIRRDKHYGVEALEILDPTRVEPVIEETSGELYYQINAAEGTYYVHSHEIVHVRHVTIGYKGISPISVLRGTIEYDEKIRKFSLDQMNHSIKSSFVLKHTGDLGEAEQKKLMETFERFYASAGGVIPMGDRLKLDPITSEFIDPKLFEAEKITKARVALVFNLPLYKVGEAEDLGTEGQTLTFMTDTLLPIVRQYEQEFNKKLLTQKEKKTGFSFKFNMGGLLRADTKTRGEFYRHGVRTGFITPNEARAYEEFPPAPNGDKLLVSKDLQPLDVAVNPTAKGVKKDGSDAKP